MRSRRRLDPRGWSVSLRVVVLVGVLLLGYVTVSAATRDTDCFPGPPQAAPEAARPGEAVLLTATAFPCDRRYHRGALYGLQFRSADAADPVDLGLFPVATDGSFQAEVAVPEGTAAGPGTFLVTGFDIRDVFAEVCDDDSGGCAPYSAVVTVT
jgi:hypothetical protein